MVKTRVVVEGQDTVLFGLSRNDLERMLDGKPMQFDGSHIGLHNINFLVFVGDTDADIVASMRTIGMNAEPMWLHTDRGLLLYTDTPQAPQP